jgi:hypothetical protein
MGVDQSSGTSVVDFSGGQVEYKLDYTMLGSNNPKLSQQTTMRVKIILK